MTTTTATRPVDDAWREHEPPPLAAAERLALHVGLQLLLWSRRSGERADRAEQARRNRGGDHAAAAAQDVFVRRTAAGPIW